MGEVFECWVDDDSAFLEVESLQFNRRSGKGPNTVHKGTLFEKNCVLDFDRVKHKPNNDQFWLVKSI